MRPESEQARGVSFTVPGNPVPTARARKGAHGWFTPQRTIDYKGLVLAHAVSARMKARRLGQSLDPASLMKLTVWFYRKDWRRCDTDNLIKGLKDAITESRIWGDDSQVIEEHIYKRVSVQEPRTIVVIEEAQP